MIIRWRDMLAIIIFLPVTLLWLFADRLYSLITTGKWEASVKR